MFRSSGIDINNLVDFDDLGDLLKESGIICEHSTNSKTNNQVDPSVPQIIMDDPFQLPRPIKHGIELQTDLDNCLICCNPLYTKITLPCGHIFCYSCIKGSIIKLSRGQHAKCPLCLYQLDRKLTNIIKKQPHLLDGNTLEINHKYLSQLDVFWFYSSRQNGWWAFDIANNIDIENLYQKSLKDEEIEELNHLSIYGMRLLFDFKRMLQINEYNNSRRSIKRVEKNDIEKFLDTGLVKGLAGYRANI